MASSDSAYLLENTGSMGRSAKILIHSTAVLTWYTVKQYFFGVFPSIGEMLVSVGVKEAEIGFYAGTWEDCEKISCSLGCNILSLDQAWWKPTFQQQNVSFCSSFGQALSERIGRRPVMLICVAGISTSAVLYGLSQSAWQMILFRAMAGCFSGCSG